MISLLRLLLSMLTALFKPMWRLEAENAALRQQLIVLRRKMKGRPQVDERGPLVPSAAVSYDRDSIYGDQMKRRLRAMGIRDKPTAPRSPRQNAYVERLIGSIRRECVDHCIVVGEAHLRRILRCYARYYNDLRTHRSLGKDAPISRSIERFGKIESRPLLGGLHHHYSRI